MADAPLFYPDEAAVIRLGERFIDCTLPKAEWTHAAHFAVCLWILQCRDDLDAARDMPDLIRRYNIATGGINSDEAGYHETITQASIRATRAHLGQYGAKPLHIHHAELMAGPCGRKDWLLEYWSSESLMHVRARKGWTEPDRHSLPF
ncbi:MAG: hypothetical protein ACSLE1_16085 [Sphingobium sp.]